MKDDFYTVQVKTARIRGDVRAIPLNDHAKNFCSLTGNKTLSGYEITTIRLLGFHMDVNPA